MLYQRIKSCLEYKVMYDMQISLIYISVSNIVWNIVARWQNTFVFFRAFSFVSDVSDVSDVSETIWSSPESGSMNGSESEPYIIENVPNKKLLQANKPFPATEKRNPDETSTVFVCRIHPCSNTTFESLDDHHRHLEINHPEKPYICSRCPFASHIPHRTLAHEKSHKTNEMVYRENHEGAYCRLCNIIFASSSNGRYKSALRQHQKQYH